VGYVGRLANEKRISDLRYLDRDPSVQLIITGDGPALGKLRAELPRAIFTGFKSGEDLAEVYATLDLFIHPGPNETFCQSVQEALASGTPCIVPTTGGPSDLVTHGKTGYIIHTHRPDELDAAVHHFMMRNDRAQMKLDARASVVERTWERINGELISHYQEVRTQVLNSKEIAA
jgi:phosphatidylinositol alpha 1,6-mannosyltransferase